MRQTDLEKWLTAARKGDRQAFGNIQQTLEPQVRRFISRLIGWTPNEDDIVQNCFLALYVNLKKLETVAYMRPFLFRVVRNQCYDTLRKQGRYETVAITTIDAATTGKNHSFTAIVLRDENPSPDDQTHWRMMLEIVRTAMDKLPEVQRQTMMLYYEFEMSTAEIATAMHTKTGTVKSRLFTARKMLIRLLPQDIVALLRGEFSQIDHIEGEKYVRNGRQPTS